MRHGSRIAAEDDLVAETLGQLRDELAVVRQVLDEIRSELQWANRNRDDSHDAEVQVDGNASLTPVPARSGRPIVRRHLRASKRQPNGMQ